jgi:homocysteine S-methyltransferase
VDQLVTFLERARSFAPHLPVIAGICPLTSFRNAEFMNNEVPGISVPPAVMERMRAADSGERARLEGLRIAQETLVEIRSLVQGVQIAAPFGRYALAVEVAQALGTRQTVPSAPQP